MGTLELVGGIAVLVAVVVLGTGIAVWEHKNNKGKKRSSAVNVSESFNDLTR